jgi:hypothetical protein
MKTELIELDLSKKEQESYIRKYIINNMSEITLEQYIHVLNITDSSAEACKAAILNEYINSAIHHSLKEFEEI